MAKVISEFNEYVGISNDTWTDGLHPMITAAIPEFNPLEKRDLGEMRVYQATTEDCIGNTGGTSKVNRVKTVVCTYFGNSANALIPCIHRGERVRVFNYAGTEQYYWREWGKDAGLRKCERIRWFAMDKKRNGKHWSTDKMLGALPPQIDAYNDDGGDTPTIEYTYSNATDKNTYFVEINTNPGDKGFRIHTCKEDGEPFIYDIAIWPERGILEISDNGSGGGCKNGLGNCPCHMDTGNNIRLNSFEHWWHIRNVDDSCIDICKENIFMKCKNTISLIAGKDIVESAGIRYTRIAPVQNITGNQRTTTLSCIDTVHAPAQVFNGQSQVCNFGITKGVFKNIDLTGETYKLYANVMNLGGDTFFCTAKFTFIVQAGIAVTVTTPYYELNAGYVYWNVGYFYFCVSSFSMSCGGGGGGFLSPNKTMSAHDQPLSSENDIQKVETEVVGEDGKKTILTYFDYKYKPTSNPAALASRYPRVPRRNLEEGVMELDVLRRITMCIPYIHRFDTKFNMTRTDINFITTNETHDEKTLTINAKNTVKVTTTDESHHFATLLLQGSASVTVNVPLEQHNFATHKWVGTNKVDIVVPLETHTDEKLELNGSTYIKVKTPFEEHISDKYELKSSIHIYATSPLEVRTIDDFTLNGVKTVTVNTPLETHNVSNKYILKAKNLIDFSTTVETHFASDKYNLVATNLINTETTDEIKLDHNKFDLTAKNLIRTNTTDEIHTCSNLFDLTATNKTNVTTKDETHVVGHDEVHKVTHDEIHQIGNDETHTIVRDEVHTIHRDEIHKVDRDDTHSVGRAYKMSAGSSVNVDTVTETHTDRDIFELKATNKVNIETKDETHVVGHDEVHQIGNDEVHTVGRNDTHVVEESYHMKAKKHVHIETKEEVHDFEEGKTTSSKSIVFSAPAISASGTTSMSFNTPTETHSFNKMTLSGTNSLGVTVPTETHKNTTETKLESKKLTVDVEEKTLHKGGNFTVENTHGRVPVVIHYGSSSW